MVVSLYFWLKKPCFKWLQNGDLLRSPVQEASHGFFSAQTSQPHLESIAVTFTWPRSPRISATPGTEARTILRPGKKTTRKRRGRQAPPKWSPQGHGPPPPPANLLAGSSLFVGAPLFVGLGRKQKENNRTTCWCNLENSPNMSQKAPPSPNPNHFPPQKKAPPTAFPAFQPSILATFRVKSSPAPAAFDAARGRASGPKASAPKPRPAARSSTPSSEGSARRLDERRDRNPKTGTVPGGYFFRTWNLFGGGGAGGSH